MRKEEIYILVVEIVRNTKKDINVPLRKLSDRTHS